MFRLYLILVPLILCICTGCAVIPGDIKYPGPIPRPPTLDKYYTNGGTYQSVREEIIKKKPQYYLKRIFIQTDVGKITIDYYQRHQKNPYLIFVFPILGGRNTVEGYFARYFAKNGFDTAIVHRDKDFKKPEQFDNLETIFKNNVIRDRLAMDFFEKQYDKKLFGSFGISRGAINAAMTAGVDQRLKYNVFALGGSNLVGVFRDSSVPGITRYRRQVTESKKISDEEFFKLLGDNVKTDPKSVASYIDARNTLMIIALFDTAVPLRYGLKLRREIGTPRTVFLLSGHYSGVLFTQFFKILPPSDNFCIFPFDFIESEALAFYNKSFQNRKLDFRQIPYAIIQFPFELIGHIYYSFIRDERFHFWH